MVVKPEVGETSQTRLGRRLVQWKIRPVGDLVLLSLSSCTGIVVLPLGINKSGVTVEAG